MSESGYIKLFRSIQDNELWYSEPLTKAQAWVDILLSANFRDGGFYVRGVWVEVKRGQCARSELTMAKLWKWSREKVRRYIDSLRKRGQVEVFRDNKTTILTICNYDSYQSFDKSNETPNETPERHQKDTKRDTNNNEKKDKNEKIKYVVDYLNKKSGKNFKYSTQKTKDCIKARINEGFNGNDFKTVIDIKTAEWLNTDMEKFIRPETLFGNKFESYLNQKSNQQPDNQSKADKANEYLNS